jgi:hypothetical protein
MIGAGVFGLAGCSGSAPASKAAPQVTYVTLTESGTSRMDKCHIEMAGIQSQASKVNCEPAQ